MEHHELLRAVDAPDLRCWRFREGEKRIFRSPKHVPENEGWVDSPAKIKPQQRNSLNGQEADKAQERRIDGEEGRGFGQEAALQDEARQSQGQEQSGVLNFEGLSKEDLLDIAAKAGVSIDKRWGRSRIEQALRDA